MSNRKIRIKSKLLLENEDSFVVHPRRIQLELPKRYIIASQTKDYYSKNVTSNIAEWTAFIIDNDYFKNVDILTKLSRLKNAGHVFIYGTERFGIKWDEVLEKVYSREPNYCFFCDQYLSKQNKTKDHLIPRVILKAYNLIELDDNTVPCCETCNEEKASLHPYIYRTYLKNMLQNTKRDSDRRTRALHTLNLILINDKDPFE